MYSNEEGARWKQCVPFLVNGKRFTVGAFFLMDSMTCQLQLLSSVSVCLMANKFMVLAAVFFGLLLCGGSASGAYGRNDQAVLWAVLFEVVSGQRTEAVFVSVCRPQNASR